MLTGKYTKLTPLIIPTGTIGSDSLQKLENSLRYAAHEPNDMIISQQALLEQSKDMLLDIEAFSEQNSANVVKLYGRTHLERPPSKEQ
jgi:hypothetical protein